MDPQPALGNKSLIPQLEDILDLYLVKKAPFQLPANVKEFIVKFGPYITLILMLLALPVILLALGLSAVLLPMVGAVAGVKTGITATLGLVLAIATLVLEAVALPGLFKRSKVGWNFVFYAVLISAVSYLISLDIFSLIIGTLVSLYFLFQIRAYYK
jgi:hypothetical protein